MTELTLMIWSLIGDIIFQQSEGQKWMLEGKSQLVGGGGEWSCGSFLLKSCKLAVCSAWGLQLFAFGILHITTRSGFGEPLPSVSGEMCLLARGHQTISGLLPKTYSWQIVSFKDSTQITCPRMPCWDFIWSLNCSVTYIGQVLVLPYLEHPVTFHCSWNKTQ